MVCLWFTVEGHVYQRPRRNDGALPRHVKCKYVTVKVELTCDKMTSGLISAPSAHLWPASEWLR